MKKQLYISLLVLGACTKGPLVQVSQSRHSGDFLEEMSNRVVLDSALVAADNRFYFGSSSGTVFCVQSENNRNIWRQKLSGSIDTSILVDESKTYAGTGDGRLYALDRKSGKPLWNATLSSPPRGMMTKINSTVLVGTNDGTLLALDQDNGNVLWKYHHEPYEKMKIQFFIQGSVEKNRLFIGFPNGQLVALDAQTGTEVWNKSIQDPQARFYDLASITLVQGKGILASLVAGPSTMYSFEGTELWSIKDTSTQAQPIVLADGQILIAAKNKLLWVDSNGGVKSSIEYPRTVHPAGVAYDKGLIYVSSLDGGLHVFNEKQWLWEYQMGISVQGAPIVMGDRIWVLNRLGELIAMKRN